MQRTHAGFTLLETLVALSIIAVALLAALRAMGSTASAASHLREHTIATWIAENRLAELRARQEWPAVGQRGGHGEMAGRRYAWTETVSGTANPLFRRVDIEVRAADGDTTLGRLSGFAVRPLR